MKTLQKGFIVPLLLVIIALALVGGVTYLYTQNKSANQPTAESPVTQKTSTTQVVSNVSTNTTQSIVQAITAPEITSLSPSSGPVGTAVTLKGSFPADTAIIFGGEIVGQTAAHMSSFTFVVPSSFAVHGLGPPSVPVIPENYTISLANGNSVEFIVTPTPAPVPDASAPTVTSISPSKITVGATKDITIYGSNFGSKSMIAVVGSGVVTSIGPTRISSDGTSMTFTFPEVLTIPALYSVEVYDVGDVQDYTHGGPRAFNSTIVVTLVNPYTPAVISITPTQTTVGSTVTISGSNFYSDSRVQVGTWLPSVATDFGLITISSYNSTSLSFVVPPSMSPGKYIVAVVGSAGHRSNELIFTVVAP